MYEEHDALAGLKARAEKTLLAEARKHREWHLLKTCPGLGPIRTAELLPVVVTPYRILQLMIIDLAMISLAAALYRRPRLARNL